MIGLVARDLVQVSEVDGDGLDVPRLALLDERFRSTLPSGYN
jgi:hypothetical protein